MPRKTIYQPDNGSIFRKIPYAAVSLFLLLAASPATPGEFQVGTEAEWTSALEVCSRNGQADTIHLTSSIKLTAPHPFTAENHPLEIVGNGQCIDGNGLARCLDIKDMKNALINAHLAIRNVRFLNGAAPAAGGLLINYRTPGNNSDVNIHACTFEKNHAVLWEHGWGGGAYINTFDGSVTLTENRFVRNSAAGGAGGAKIEASGSGAILVTGNFFEYNTAAFWYGGVLVHCVGTGPLKFSENAVSGNSSLRMKAGGAGVWMGDDVTGGGWGNVYGNSVTGNEAPEVAGLYVWTRGGSSLEVSNNTITDNRGNIGLYIRADHPQDRIHLERNTISGHELNLQIHSAGEGTVSGHQD
ncbi:MAG: right-handed parallel beta-helix repeat-containing protein [Desulfatiglandaceae bacterium]